MKFENTIFNTDDPGELHRELHRSAILYKGIALDLVDTLTPDDLDRIITIQGIGHPYVFLLNTKRGIKKMPFYPYTEIFHRVLSPIKAIREYINEGTTLFFHNMQNHHPVIAALHNQLKRKFPSLDKTVCFLSPANSQATRPHADDHPNIVFQIAGAKHWQVWEAVEEEQLKGVGSVDAMDQLLGKMAASNTPIIDEVLRPGDVLVVPQRFLHTALTREEYSLSIVFQIRCCNLDLGLEQYYEDQIAGSESEHEFVEII